MVNVFREVRRVLKPEGTLWLNLGSSYSGFGQGRNSDGSLGKVGDKQQTNAGSCYDKQPNQSRPDAPAYGTYGKEQLNYQENGRVYPDCDDEYQGSLLNDIFHKTPQLHADVSQPCKTDRDKQRQDFVSAFLGVLLPCVQESTIFSSCDCVLDACGHATKSLVCRKGFQTTSGDVPPCVGKTAYTSCIVESLRSLAHHKLDKELSFEALLNLSNIDNIALTLLYYTIKHLKFKPKDEINIPFLVAFALQADGWWLRQDIIWHKPNPMPESVTDRCTKAHEYIFLLSKSAKYYYDNKAIYEPYCENSDMEYRKTLRLGKYYRAGNQNPYKDNTPLAGDREITPLAEGKNKRSVWTVTTKPYPDAHFATFPPDLIEPCILAGCPKDGIVLDPYMGSGTTACVAIKNGRNYIGCELNPEYINLGRVNEAETGVPVEEARQGQKALFE